MPTPTPLDAEPLSVRRGDTAKWYRAAGEFPAADWTLTYAFARQQEQPVTVTATADTSSRWLAELLVATSQSMTAGTWRWQARVTDGSEVYTLATGSIVVEPSYADDAVVDPRTFAERMVELLEARLERRAPSDIASSSAEAYSVSIMPDADARAQLDYWRRRVAIETNAAAAREGRGTRAKILTQMWGR